MNEKSSPSNTVPLKSYAHSEDAPHGEWFLISNAKGGLYGYRWHEEDATDMYLTREVIDSRDEWEFNGVTNCELEFLPSLSRFLSGEHGIDGEPKWRDDEDGHPCFWSYKDFPSNSGCRVIGDTGGELKAYRNAHGVYLVDEFKLDKFSILEADEDPKDPPTFYYEELDDVVRFFAGMEGGLAR